MKKIGFIGLGIMGKHMARNLMRAGYPLVVYDIVPDPVKELEKEGAVSAESIRAVTEQTELIITMLPNSPHVKEAVMGDKGILEGAKPNTILVDMSSIAPLASKEIYEACKKSQVHMLDAPVSGGEPKAIDGTLSIMVGGDEDIFKQVQDVLLKMGSSAVYCGDIGAGNTTKLANQVIVALNIAALSEALVLGKKAGVDPSAIYNAIKGGLAGSTVMNAKAPMMMEGNFTPGFRINLHIKDLQNVMDTGHEIGAHLPLSAAVMEMLQWLKANDCGGDDHSAIVKYYESITGTDVRSK